MKHTPNVTRTSHYIAMAGLSGYMPSYTSAHDTKRSAVDDLLALHDLSATSIYARALRKDSYTSLSPKKHGNEYAEITLCDCDNLAQHNDD